MKKSLKFSLTVAAIATATLGQGAPVLARGGAASIMNSPGYQRRLQESRQQVSQPDTQPVSAHRGHKSRHHHLY
jgi:hypothetical protein